MRLKRLTMTAFGSFGTETTIEFPENGLMLIKGPSGAGKSTIFKAIAYALGICNHSAKALQSDLTDDPLQVVLELTEPDIIVRRGAISELIVSGITVCTTAKDLDKQLAETTGLSAAFRELLTYRDQSKPYKFLDLSDSEAKSLLTKLLGLEVFEDRVKSTQDKVKELEASLASRLATIEGMERMLGTPPTRPDLENLPVLKNKLAGVVELHNTDLTCYDLIVKQSEVEMQSEVDKLMAECLETQAAVYDNPKIGQIQHVIERYQDESDDCEKAQVEVRTKINARYKELVKIKRAWEQEDAYNADIDRQIEDCKAKLEGLKNGVCNNCKQAYFDAVANSKLKMELAVLPGKYRIGGIRRDIIEDELAELENPSPTSPDPVLVTKANNIRDKLRELREQLTVEMVAKKDFDSQKTIKIMGLNAQIEKLRSDHQRKCRELRPASIDQEVFNLNAQIDVLKAQSAGYESDLTRYEGQLLKIMSAKSVAKALELDLNEELDVLEFLKGFVGRIFEEILVQIADETNQILSQLPNTSDVTIEFLTEKEQSNGKVKGTITPVLRFGGKIRSLKSGASGGMKSAVELAVDLALANVVAKRTGKTMHFLMLDECFSGFDQNTREELLAILENYAQDGRLVMQIEHASETQACFSKTLSVNLNNGASEIEWS